MSGLGLTSLLLVFGLLELETLLGDADQLLVLELLQLGDGVLVDGVDEEEDFEALLLQNLKERRVFDGGEGFTGQVVDRLLDLRHAGDVVLEGSLLICGLGGVEPEVLGEFGSVLSVFMDTELDVFSEGFVELGEVVLILGNLGEQVHAFLDEVLANDLQYLVLLEGLTGDVEGEILRVDDALDEVEVLGNEVLTVVHDEDTADVKLNVVALLLGLEEIEGSPWFDTSASFQQIRVGKKYAPLGNVDDGLELELTLDREVLNGKVLFPVVGQTLVESAILVRGDLLWVPRPEGLGLVELLVLGGDLLNLLRLLGLFFVVNLLDLGLLLIFVDLFLVVLDILESSQTWIALTAMALSLTFSTSLVTAN